MLRIWMAVLLTATFVSATVANDYGRWKMNKEKKRAECVYYYTNKSGKTSYNTVLRYPVDDPKVGWDYFLNAEGKVWAKYMNKRNPKFKKGVMQWALCEPDGKVKQMMKENDCPTPKDGKEPITEDVPDPTF